MQASSEHRSGRGHRGTRTVQGSDCRRPLLGRKRESPIPVDLAVLGSAQQLEKRFPDKLWFRGELVEVREARAGRLFGSLRGESSRIDLHISPSVAHGVAIPETGTNVLVQGRLRIWEPAGEFRIEATSPLIATDTAGARAATRRAVERQLRAEGVLDARKRPVPSWPRSVAVVTSPRGAAIDDVRSVIRRRAPWVSVQVHECVVQGPGGPLSIARALEAASRSLADLVILTRGGGSTDSLDAFDDPTVVRQVARSRMPIIVAVGHQRDRTLSDLAADVSAPTPSAAAERAVPDRKELSKHVKALSGRIDAAIRQRLIGARTDVGRSERLLTSAVRQCLVSARVKLGQAGRQTDERAGRLLSSMRESLSRLDPGSSRSRIGLLVMQQLTRSDELASRIDRAVRNQVAAQRMRVESSRLTGLFDRLKGTAASDRYRADRLWRSARALSPSELLSRGYAMVIGPGSTTVKGAKDLRSETELDLVFEDGTAAVVVQKVEHRIDYRRDS